MSARGRSPGWLRSIAWLALPLIFAIAFALAPRAHGAADDGRPPETGGFGECMEATEGGDA